MEELCNKTAEYLQLHNNDTTFSPEFSYHHLDKLQEAHSFWRLNCSDELLLDLDEELHDPEYYSHTYRLIGTIFQGIIFIVGLLGNFLVVLVVAKTKSMHTPTNCYIVSLAVADIIVLVAAVPNEIIFYYLVGDRWLWGEWGCAIFSFAQYLGINASSLSLTAFTVERYIAICHPMKAQTMCTVNRAKKIIMGVWLFSVIYCSPWLSLTKLKPIPYKGFEDVQKCSFKLSRETYLYYFLIDLIAFYVCPLVLSVVLYGLIARILFATHTNVKSVAGGTKSNGQLTVDSTKTNAARKQVVKMLVMVVVIFAVLWLPYRGMVVYNSFAAMYNREPFMDLWFLMLAKTCIFMNSAINPILYNAMSVKFRRAFGRTLSCGKRAGSSGTGYYRSHGGSVYGRWNTRGGGGGNGNYTTYSCASTAAVPATAGIPSSSTIQYNNVTNLAVGSSSSNRKLLKSRLHHHAHPHQHHHKTYKTSFNKTHHQNHSLEEEPEPPIPLTITHTHHQSKLPSILLSGSGRGALGHGHKGHGHMGHGHGHKNSIETIVDSLDSIHPCEDDDVDGDHDEENEIEITQL